ncbi:MAG: single-stranded DNA-binding protein [Chloroflexota bacterium]
MNKGLNKVMIIGWVDGNPEVRHTPNGRPVASFSVGTSRSWISTEGAKHEETEWFNVVAWGNLAELSKKRLSRGHKVYIEGRLQTRSWEDSSGRRHFRTEVVAQDLIALNDYEE